MSASFDDLISRVKECDKKDVVVAAAEEDAELEAVSAAHAQGIADAMLVGCGLVIAIRILSAHFRWNLPHAHD